MQSLKTQEKLEELEIMYLNGIYLYGMYGMYFLIEQNLLISSKKC